MKHITNNYRLKTGTVLLASVILVSVTACTDNGNSKDQPTEETTTGTTFILDTIADNDLSDPDPSTDSTIPAIVLKNAYGSYISILESFEEDIKRYTWMNTGWNDSNWLFPENNIPCALFDLTGDGIEEMIIMKETGNMTADLSVYSYDQNTDETSLLLTVEYLNPQLDSGRGFAAGVTNEGKLLIYDCPRGNTEYSTCIIYSYNGSELLPELSTADMVSSDDAMTQIYHSYKLNDEGVDENTYTTTRDSMIDSMDYLMQYGFVFGDKIQSRISGMTSIAMSYDQMYDYLYGNV